MKDKRPKTTQRKSVENSILGVRGDQTSLAALKIQSGSADAAELAAAAKIVATQAAHENGRAGIQIHGAIGFQSECDAHWFMKRAHLYDLAGGSMLEQARWIVREAGRAQNPRSRILPSKLPPSS